MENKHKTECPEQSCSAKTKKHLLPKGLICLVIIVALFGGIGWKMGMAPMLNTIMHTAHDLLLNTCFYLMAICVLTGALGKLFVEFGVVDLIEKVLRPLMRPVFRLPGVASLGAVLTFLSDNPAIITLAHDKHFSGYFKKYQYISLTNFGTAFGMGLIVIVFMLGQGYMLEPLLGFVGACCGCIVSTRLMQYFVLKAYPQYKEENALDSEQFEKQAERPTHQEEKSTFLRTLNSLLDGGKSGVEVGISIIPGVLIISTLVMILTFGPSADGTFTGKAYEGIAILPTLANKLDWLLQPLFGFSDPHQIAFPITALGAVGAALSLVPNFLAQGWIDGNAIAVFTGIGMCWSGFLSTHTAMLDTIGYRELTSKAIMSHCVGGLVAALVAHGLFLVFG
ncbi:MAG: nucleoside recognition domain-containing protein [Prevotella sp.]|nr:nucleoside recognition domain-containing protein [Prevotella sp.]MDY4218075.1 nucleoside recognition domain-containing protein [Prevotella sp.]